MKSYRFAQIFVRLSRWIGVLAFILGIVYAGVGLLQTLGEVKLATYTKSGALELKLERLHYENERVFRILRSARIPSVDEAPQVRILTECPDNLKGFQELLTNLESSREEFRDLKSGIISEFESSLLSIEEKLLAHAKSLQGSAGGRETRQEDASARPYGGPKLPEHIYIPSLEDTFESFHSNIDAYKEFLENLRDESSQASSKEWLRSAIDEMNRLSKLLPVKNPTFESPPIESSEPESEDGSSEPQFQDLRALEMVGIIREIRSDFRSMILERWLVEGVWAEAYGSVTEENESCKIAIIKTGEIWRDGISEVVIRIILSVVLAFLILVIADFLQTQLDIAKNSLRVADSVDPELQS